MPPAPQHEPSGREIARLIDALALDEAARRYLNARWLDQLVWMEGRSAGAQRWYYALRLTAILGGVAIPALVGWQGASTAATAARVAAGLLGVVVAAASAVEGLYRFGERWEHYRRGAEALKAEFWRMTQLGGPYRDFPDHRAAFPIFVDRVEQILQEDVQTYFAQIQTHTGRDAQARPGPDHPEGAGPLPRGNAPVGTSP